MQTSFDIVIIGSGPGGYVAAIRAAQLGLQVACVEKEALGGTCLNVGCIPSKTLLHSTELYWKVREEGKELGIFAEKCTLSFSHLMARKQKVVEGFNSGIAGLFQKNKIALFQGVATLASPTSVLVQTPKESLTLTAKFILLATGSEPISLPFMPFDEKSILSSTGALALSDVPRRLIVIGAGVIGVELGSVYKRLGAEVIFVEFLDRICPTFDETLSKAMEKELKKQGMQFYLSSKVTAAKKEREKILLNVTLPDNSSQEMEADKVLVSIGRRPFTKDLGLEKVGITPTDKGFIPIDGQFRTRVPTIFAIGDIVDGPMLAHKASDEGIAAVELIAGKRPSIDYLAIPNVVYTYPEMAAVGMSEKEAKGYGLNIVIGSFPFKANSRARCTKEEIGFVKIIAEEKTKQLLGIHILGPHASELIAEGALAIQKRCTLHDIIETPHAHPTLAEALREAALSAEGRALHL